jgi:NTP pyrophosphatase (non-canonical NTP hydrolase)
MELNHYQTLAMRTAREFTTDEEALVYGALKLSGEAGELANKIGKMFYHGKEVSDDELIEELGDALWYAAFLADALGVTLAQVARRNLAKLSQRHGAQYNPEHYTENAQ